MPYIRHESLFPLQDLYELEQKDRFAVIFSAVDITPVLHVVSKKSRYGAPVEINVQAMIYSLIVRVVERIPTIKDLLKRPHDDILFRMDCGFTLAEKIPSAASYSRACECLSERVLSTKQRKASDRPKSKSPLQLGYIDVQLYETGM
jgi:transposase